VAAGDPAGAGTGEPDLLRSKAVAAGPRARPVRLNAAIQGRAADGLERAPVLLWERRRQCPGARPVLTSHDEIVIECEADQAATVIRWLERAMRDGMAPLLRPVPVVVVIAVSASCAHTVG
jgi:DNA polymerase I-like protein with 3'-5' exonuclease and polymerase domains